jgi:hypothetical protein
MLVIVIVPVIGFFLRVGAEFNRRCLIGASRNLFRRQEKIGCLDAQRIGQFFRTHDRHFAFTRCATAQPFRRFDNQALAAGVFQQTGEKLFKTCAIDDQNVAVGDFAHICGCWFEDMRIDAERNQRLDFKRSPATFCAMSARNDCAARTLSIGAIATGGVVGATVGAAGATVGAAGATVGDAPPEGAGCAPPHALSASTTMIIRAKNRVSICPSPFIHTVSKKA